MVNFTSFLIKGVLPIAISMLMRGSNLFRQQMRRRNGRGKPVTSAKAP